MERCLCINANRKAGLLATGIRAMSNHIEVMRAEQEWQRAGAYSVRIQGMNRQHHISLRDEFDEHDGDGTRYIILLDDGYPIATARFFEKSKNCVIIGRVVVLPEYRGLGMGRKVLQEAEDWICELGYREIKVDSRTVAVGFYEKNGYQCMNDVTVKSGSFECIRMHKHLENKLC